MAGNRACGAAENHAPGRIGRRAPQLAVDEVGAASEEQAHRHTDDGDVHQAQIGHLHQASSHDAGNQRANETAMETHTPVAEVQNLKRIGGVVGEVVHQHISQTGAHDHADHGADEHDAQVVGGEAHLPTLAHQIDDADSGQKTDDVGNAIPAGRERTDGERDGVEALIQLVEHGIPLLTGNTD